MGTVYLKWVGSRLMTGADSSGNTLVIGRWSEKEPAWDGIKPSDLLLLSAAACSAYDVVHILSRQREPLEDLEVTCTGEQLPDPPYTFTSLHLHYRIKGDCDMSKVDRAIRLSNEKYCSVVTTLRPALEITSDFEVV